MSRAKIFLYSCVFFILGIALASFLSENLFKKDVYFFGLSVLLLILAILFCKNKKILIISLFGLFLFLGIWRYSISLPINSPDKIWHYNGQEVIFQGVLNKEPDVRIGNQKLEVKADSARTHHGAFLPAEGKVLVTTDLYPSYNYGDYLEIKCNLQTPERFNGFSYDRYLARYDIYSLCYWPDNIQSCPTTALGGKRRDASSPFKGELEGVRISFYKKIYYFKDKLREKINQNMSEPEASVAKAIILGDKKQIPDNLREKFSQVGLSHIIAISGMHISIIAGILMLILLQLGLSRRKAFLLASIFLFIYIAIIGFPASAIRAGIMGFLVLFALISGRLSKLTNLLFFTAFILLLINPKLLRDDVGFQLSFLAVLGIAWIYRVLDELFEKFKIPNMYGARDIINITISAQIFTLPIIAINFNQISLVSVLSNLLVIWILPILMIAIIVALVLSFLFSNLGIILFLPSVIILKYVIIVTEFLSGLPFAYVDIYYVWWPWVIFYYVVVGVIINLSLRGGSRT